MGTGRSIACALGLVVSFAVAGLAQDQQDSPRRCRWNTSRIDPAFKTLANGTGGQVLALDPCDKSDSNSVAVAATAGTSLLSIDDKLSGARKTYDFAVDPSIRRVSISVTDVRRLRVEQPSGAMVPKDEPWVHHARTLNGEVYTVDEPEPGLWKVHVSGAGDVTLQVNATYR